MEWADEGEEKGCSVNMEDRLTALAAAQVAAYRAAGWLVFVEPKITGTEFSGEAAWIDCRRAIAVWGDPSKPEWLHVFLHEVAHHILGHMDEWSSEPAWVHEYEAETWALRMVAALDPAALETCTENARQHMRFVMQEYVDSINPDWPPTHGIDWNLVAWAGCRVPDYLAHNLPSAVDRMDNGRFCTPPREVKSLRADTSELAL